MEKLVKGKLIVLWVYVTTLLMAVILFSLGTNVHAASEKWIQACNIYNDFLAKNVSGFVPREFDFETKNMESYEKTSSFQIVDLDQDGAPELITLHKNAYKDEDLYIFTCKDNKVMRVKDANGNETVLNVSTNAAGSYTIYVCGRGHLHTEWTAGQALTSNAYSMRNGRIEVSIYGYCGYLDYNNKTFEVNGQTISESAYNQEIQKCKAQGVQLLCGNTAANREKVLQAATPKSISEASVTLSKTRYIYDGKMKVPTVKVVLEGKKLNEGSDYTLTYAGASGVGTAYVYVTGKGDYKDSVTKSYMINLAKPKISVSSKHHGQVVAKSKKIKGATGYQFVCMNKQGKKKKTKNSSNSKTTLKGLTAGKYYKFKVRAFAEIGGKTYYSDYSSTKKVKVFRGKSISKAVVTLNGLKKGLHVNYNGKTHEPKVKVRLGIKTLKRGKHYTVKYSSNKNAGTAKVTVTGKGVYFGKIKKTFIINKRTISQKDVKLDNYVYVYTGQALQPKVWVSFNKQLLIKDTDFTVKYTENVNSGTAAVTVTGKGNYAGNIKQNFKIEQRNLNTADVTMTQTKCTYTGKALLPEVMVKYNNTVIDASNYKAEYSNNVNIGTATVVVTGQNNFTGAVTLTFEITKELISPVPEGCKFSRSTLDEGGHWTGYHDINQNVSTSTPVYAITDGTVVFKQAHTNHVLTSYGNWMDFTSSDGIYTARYCHLDRFVGVEQIIPSSNTKRQSGGTSIILKTKEVKAGDILGYVGTTGNSTGVHLHFELYKNGQRIDPTSVFPELK